MTDYTYLIAYFNENDDISCIDRDDIVPTAEFAHHFLVSHGFKLSYQAAVGEFFFRTYDNGLGVTAEVSRADPVDFPVDFAYRIPGRVDGEDDIERARRLVY